MEASGRRIDGYQRFHWRFPDPIWTPILWFQKNWSSGYQSHNVSIPTCIITTSVFKCICFLYVMKQRVLKRFDGWTVLEHRVILSFLKPTPVAFKWLWKTCLDLKKTGKILMTWKEFTRSETHQCQVDFFLFLGHEIYCSAANDWGF